MSRRLTSPGLEPWYQRGEQRGGSSPFAHTVGASDGPNDGATEHVVARMVVSGQPAVRLARGNIFLCLRQNIERWRHSTKFEMVHPVRLTADNKRPGSDRAATRWPSDMTLARVQQEHNKCHQQAQASGTGARLPASAGGAGCGGRAEAAVSCRAYPASVISAHFPCRSSDQRCLCNLLC